MIDDLDFLGVGFLEELSLGQFSRQEIYTRVFTIFLLILF